MATVTVTHDRPAAADVDALALATLPAPATPTGARLAPGHGLPDDSQAHLRAAMDTLQLKGSAEEVVRLPGVPGVAASLVVLTGLGRVSDAAYPSAVTPEQLRRAAGAAARNLAGTDSVAFAVGGLDPARVSAVAEGALLGAYTFTRHRSTPPDKATPQRVVLCVDKAQAKALRPPLRRAEALVAAQLLARDLVNTAPNQLYPESFAQAVQDHAGGDAVKVDVMDEQALSRARCAGTLCVGQGSARPPRIVTMRYTPRRAQRHLALVGKGITFDSGGLWIKPGASMVTMKSDMAGAAAVAASVFAIAEMELPVRVTGYLCLAENMLGGGAMRPGDVITSRGGRTVEIINPDAEGRLVLLDGLELAGEEQPDAIVDIATLTGMAVVALGFRVAGLMGNDEALEQRLSDAAASVDEAHLRVPMLEEARSLLDSAVADLKHHGEREGGMQIAARFLQEFVPDRDGARGQIPWAHLDIAGPAFNTKAPYGFTPKGGTGYGVRTLVALAESFR
ncbi:MAG TPA: leucyl aminopeptidase [Dermatophilaceae bacterium]|nr:leucyl aminopeptidase [Dermatophilaceae bacterium]